MVTIWSVDTPGWVVNNTMATDSPEVGVSARYGRLAPMGHLNRYLEPMIDTDNARHHGQDGTTRHGTAQQPGHGNVTQSSRFQSIHAAWSYQRHCESINDQGRWKLPWREPPLNATVVHRTKALAEHVKESWREIKLHAMVPLIRSNADWSHPARECHSWQRASRAHPELNPSPVGVPAQVMVHFLTKKDHP